MKQTPLILSIIALLGVVALCVKDLTGNNGKKNTTTGETVETVAKEGSVVWYDLDRVLNEYDMANDLRSVVETKIQSIQEEVTRRGNKLQSDANKFQSDLNKGLLVRSVAEQRGQKLQEQQNSFNNYAAQKEQEMAEEQQVMMNQIADAIKSYIDKFNEEHKYAMIIATQGSLLPAPVSCGDPDLDITDALLQGLNAEYVKTKGNGGNTTTPATKAE